MTESESDCVFVRAKLCMSVSEWVKKASVTDYHRVIQKHISHKATEFIARKHMRGRLPLEDPLVTIDIEDPITKEIRKALPWQLGQCSLGGDCLPRKRLAYLM